MAFGKRDIRQKRVAKIQEFFYYKKTSKARLRDSLRELEKSIRAYYYSGIRFTNSKGKRAYYYSGIRIANSKGMRVLPL